MNRIDGGGADQRTRVRACAAGNASDHGRLDAAACVHLPAISIRPALKRSVDHQRSHGAGARLSSGDAGNFVIVQDAKVGINDIAADVDGPHPSAEVAIEVGGARGSPQLAHGDHIQQLEGLVGVVADSDMPKIAGNGDRAKLGARGDAADVHEPVPVNILRDHRKGEIGLHLQASAQLGVINVQELEMLGVSQGRAELEGRINDRLGSEERLGALDEDLVSVNVDKAELGVVGR